MVDGGTFREVQHSTHKRKHISRGKSETGGEGVRHNFGREGIHIRFRRCSTRQSQEA